MAAYGTCKCGVTPAGAEEEDVEVDVTSVDVVPAFLSRFVSGTIDHVTTL